MPDRSPRRWFRVWFKYPEDYRSEDTLLIQEPMSTAFINCWLAKASA